MISAGPRERAGFKLVPDTGASRKTSNAIIIPTTIPVKGAVFLKLVKSKIAAIGIEVITSSAPYTTKREYPSPGNVIPRLTLLAESPNATKAKKLPNSAPLNCISIYIIAFRMLIFLNSQKLSVTAGLIWPPLLLPREEYTTKVAPPAKSIPISKRRNNSDGIKPVMIDPLPKFNAIAPIPMKKRRAVPINSARYSLLLLRISLCIILQNAGTHF